MAHTICTSEAGGELGYFQRLWRILFAPDIDTKAKLEHLFEHETTEFELEYAFLSNIDLENKTERFEIAHSSHEALQAGTTVPLSNTYCRKTIADPEGTVAISDALAEGWGEDPAYETFKIGSYLGTTVTVDHKLYGTLCFANSTARDDPIRDEEKALLELLGQWVEYTLSRSEVEPIRETRLDATERRTISSEAIDLMMEGLGNRTRRIVLMTLVGNTTETSVGTLEERVNDENAHIQLLHSDLPKLANTGYINWDKDSEMVSRGPRFSEVEPLAQLLKEYNTEFSE